MRPQQGIPKPIPEAATPGAIRVPDMVTLAKVCETVTFDVRSAGQSVTGAHRPTNQDRFYVDSARHLFIVADGMGGQQAGEQASQMAVDLLSTKLVPPANEAGPKRGARLFSLGRSAGSQLIARIQKAITEANAEIMALGQLDSRYHSMGTTVVLALVHGRDAFVAGVGDSRAYLIREANIQQLTCDHSVAESLAQAGAISPEEARGHRFRNVLWKYLGAKEAAHHPEVCRIRLRQGDRLLLATDGLTSVVEDAQLRDIVLSHSDPQAAIEALVQQALDNDSTDNITSVAVYVD